MPKGWTPRDERQKIHVEASEKKAGKSPEEAKRIGFATINEKRRAEGRTKLPPKRKTVW